MFLSNLASRLHLVERCCDAETAVKVDSTKDHPLTFNAHHLARSKVCHEKNIFTDELFRLIIGCNTTENGAVCATSVVDSELQKLLALLHFPAVFDVTHADIQFLKVVESHFFLYRFGLISSGFIGFLGGSKLVELILNDVIFNLIEQ